MRIAQITDLHLRHHLPGTSPISPRRSRSMPSLFAQALTHIADSKPDLLAITGDLIDAPEWLIRPPQLFIMDDRRPWLDAALADYRLIKQLLDDTGLRYIILGGNHDIPDLLWQVFPRDEDVFDLNGHRIARFCDEESDGHHPRRFLDDRQRFDTLLADPASPPQIHLQHYVLTPALNEGYPHTYQEGEELTRRIVDSHKVRLCLSGHYHPGTPLLHHQSTCFSTAPAFCTWPHPWRLYDLPSQGQVTLHESALFSQRPTPQPAVFLDRDGVINDLPSYTTDTRAMRLNPGVGDAIARLNQANRPVIVITDQSCIGMGYVTPAVVHAVHDKMCRLLARHNAHLDALYFSTGAGDRAVLPQYRDRSDAKPNPALLHRAAKDLNLSLPHSVMVGDRITDLQCALAASARPILIRTGDGRKTEQNIANLPADLAIVADLPAAVQQILS